MLAEKHKRGAAARRERMTKKTKKLTANRGKEGRKEFMRVHVRKLEIAFVENY